MKLNHLNPTVTDPVAAQGFLVKYFGLTAKRKGNKNMALLSDDNGMVLALMNVNMGGASESELKFPANFHIGFIQPSEAAVNELNAALRADGYEVAAPSIQHGNWTFYFTAPGGVQIEVLC